MTQDKLIPAGKAASLLGVHPDTLRRWDADGTLTALRTPGGHRRYRMSDIEAFMADSTGSRSLTVQVKPELLLKAEKISQNSGVPVEDLVTEGLREVVARRGRTPARIRGNSSVQDLVQKRNRDD